MKLLLTACGRNARWLLSIGILVAFAFPDLGTFLRPALPLFVITVFTLAMTRVDVIATVKGFANPKQLIRSLTIVFIQIGFTAILLWALAKGFGLPVNIQVAVTYMGSAVPLASAVSLAFIMGLNAAVALEITILGCFIMPFLGPYIVGLLLGEAVPIDSLTLALRLAAMLFIAFLLALSFRWFWGADTIERQKHPLDGLGALAMLAFVFPLFDGVRYLVFAEPMAALAMLAVGCMICLLPQLFVSSLPVWSRWARHFGDGKYFGGLGLTWGNRSIAIYLAALPPDPLFTTFVALYQLPMYFTPLILGRFYRWVAKF